MTTTLLAKDTAHRTVYPVFTPGGGFAMEEMQGGGDFIMVADPSTFRILPWASKTGWFLCDIYFGNGKSVPFSTRARCRDALNSLAKTGFDILTGL
jgi:glutamine synthetase